MNSEFLLSQKQLIIFLQDGYSFFRANAEMLTRRFADPANETHILIVHPDAPNLAAVADMDQPDKSDPRSQRIKSLQAVKFLQDIRAGIVAENGFDCAGRVTFTGHDQAPVWNGFIGDDFAIGDIYPARPHRGSGPRLKAKAGELDEYYHWLLADCAMLRDQRDSARAEYANLWNYQLPDPLPDLRK